LLLRDPVLRRLARDHGRPDPFVWDVGGRTGTSNFAALLLHIAGQQISTAVAFVLFDRLRAALGRVPDPLGVASLGVERLRSFGFSRAKAQYMYGLAEMQLAGSVDVDGLNPLDDEQAIAALTAVRGIGRWSAEMFLVHQLQRPDVLPAGDLGIRRAVEAGWGLPELPSVDQVRELARTWSPYRTYAAALLWASRHPSGQGHLEGGRS
jgi:DNA-3-methyladenine glycosylase II